jgi:hypothetical protein
MSIAESFNSSILTTCEQPILATLETIRMDWFTARRLLEAKTPGTLVFTILNQLNEPSVSRGIVVLRRVFLAYSSRLQAMKLVANALLISSYVHAVVAHGCPCSHTLSVIFSHRLLVLDYTESFFNFVL